MRGRLKVLVVDDSLITIQTITRILAADPSIEVVGHALDGARAIESAERLKPDVITMDINMPRMDGIEATRQIVRSLGTPIVIVSAYASANSVALQTMQALQSGAIESVQKPSGEIGLDLDLVGAELIAKVKAASRARPSPTTAARSATITASHRAVTPQRHSVEDAAPGLASWRTMPPTSLRLVAIGVSTGGPSTLERFVPALPADYPLPLVLVIHMPEMFIPILASNLGGRSKLKVAVAAEGEMLQPGRLVIAPGGSHTTVTGDLRVRLERGPAVNGCQPAVDMLFDSIARRVVGPSLGLVLTGMGRDGAQGLAAMRARGSLTAVQDQATSVVYGMPKAAAASGAAAYEVSLPDMARFLNRAAGKG